MVPRQKCPFMCQQKKKLVRIFIFHATRTMHTRVGSALSAHQLLLLVAARSSLLVAASPRQVLRPHGMLHGYSFSPSIFLPAQYIILRRGKRAGKHGTSWVFFADLLYDAGAIYCAEATESQIGDHRSCESLTFSPFPSAAGAAVHRAEAAECW